MHSIKKYFSNYWFLIALTLLLLNDFVFKATFHNWFTGKLSDFAGLFLFPIFFAAFFKSKAKEIFIGTALFFIYFKSSYSSVFIEGFNALAPFRIQRVVDYTDLIALSILPLSYYIFSHINKVKQLNLSPIIPILLASFAIMATSKDKGFRELNKSYEIAKSTTDLMLHINSIDTQLNAFGTSLYADSSHLDTFDIELFISDVILCNSAKIYGQINVIDSTKCEIRLSNYQQSCTRSKKCFPLQYCNFTNTKEELAFILEKNFINLL